MKRISQLDGVRGVAVLLVLVWHSFPCLVNAEPGSPLAYASRLFSLTWSGVDLFFVLSGFLIAGILLDNRDAPNYFRAFYLRRVCRIFPLYFLILALFIGLSATSLATSPAFQNLFQNPFPFWSYATFTQNFLMGIRGDLGANWLAPTWSLAVEEQFYLFVPLLVYALPRRTLLWVLLVAVLTAPVLRGISADLLAYVNTPCRSDSLLAGAALAVLVRWEPFMAAVRQRRGQLLALFAVLLAGAAVLTVLPAASRSLKHFWLAGLYSVFVLIAFADTEPRLGRLLRSPVLVWFGQLSYGIYMFHLPVFGLIHGALRHSDPQIRSPLDAGITVLALGITLGVAMLSYHFVESPILRYGHRFQYYPKPKAEGASA